MEAPGKEEGRQGHMEEVEKEDPALEEEEQRKKVPKEQAEQVWRLICSSTR